MASCSTLEYMFLPNPPWYTFYLCQDNYFTCWAHFLSPGNEDRHFTICYNLDGFLCRELLLQNSSHLSCHMMTWWRETKRRRNRNIIPYHAGLNGKGPVRYADGWVMHHYWHWPQSMAGLRHLLARTSLTCNLYSQTCTTIHIIKLIKRDICLSVNCW